MSRHDAHLAAALNFVFPGAGLAYLGRWKMAFTNLALVQGVLLVLCVGYREPTLMEHIHYVFLGLAGASAGFAHAVAKTVKEMEEDQQNRPDDTVKNPESSAV